MCCSCSKMFDIRARMTSSRSFVLCVSVAYPTESITFPAAVSCITQRAVSVKIQKHTVESLDFKYIYTPPVFCLKNTEGKQKERKSIQGVLAH